jgi:hypothetical protein
MAEPSALTLRTIEATGIPAIGAQEVRGRAEAPVVTTAGFGALTVNLNEGEVRPEQSGQPPDAFQQLAGRARVHVAAVNPQPGDDYGIPEEDQREQRRARPPDQNAPPACTCSHAWLRFRHVPSLGSKHKSYVRTGVRRAGSPALA